MDLTAVKSSLIYTWHWGLFHYNSPSITDFSYTYMIFDSFQMNSHVFFLCVWCIYIRIFVDFGLRVWVPYIYLFYFIRSTTYTVRVFLGHLHHSGGREGPWASCFFYAHMFPNCDGNLLTLNNFFFANIALVQYSYLISWCVAMLIDIPLKWIVNLICKRLHYNQVYLPCPVMLISSLELILFHI